MGDHSVVQLSWLRMWAERGLIHFEDSRDGGYDVISVRECLARINGLADMLANSRRQASAREWAELLQERGKGGAGVKVEELVRFFEQGEQMCRVAQEQGMPTDPSARADLARRRKTTVSVPARMT